MKKLLFIILLPMMCGAQCKWRGKFTIENPDKTVYYYCCTYHPDPTKEIIIENLRVLSADINKRVFSADINKSYPYKNPSWHYLDTQKKPIRRAIIDLQLLINSNKDGVIYIPKGIYYLNV